MVAMDPVEIRAIVQMAVEEYVHQQTAYTEYESKARADLQAEIERLRSENEALRAALGRAAQ